MRGTMIVALAVGLALPAVAQTAAVPTAKPPKEKKICRQQGPATGSIMAARPICHTKAEWIAIDDRNGQDVSAFGDARRTDNGRN